MSRVTDAMLKCSPLEHKRARIAEVNDALFDRYDDPIQQFMPLATISPMSTTIPGSPGGYKCWSTPLYLCTFNNVPTKDLLECCVHSRWEYPDEVQLLICEEESKGFRSYELRSGGIVRLAWFTTSKVAYSGA